MARIDGLNEVQARLRSLSEQYKNASAVVGYTVNYAIHVHENLQMFHRVGQAKFLEQPARENQKKYGEIIVRGAKQRTPFHQCLLLAGLSLQRDSQLLCPVDTGALRNSAFTRLDEGK